MRPSSMLRGTSKGSRVRRVLLLCVVIGLVLFGAWMLFGPSPTRPRLGVWSPDGAPILGERVSLSEAKSRTAKPIPILGDGNLTEACSGRGEAIELQYLMASRPPTKGEPTGDSELGPQSSFVQAGAVYNLGLRMSMSPKISARNAISQGGSGKELKPIPDNETFEPGDYRRGQRGATIRGHVAWAKELDAESLCRDGTSSSQASEQRPRRGASSADGNVMWLERGWVIHLWGPYSVDELSAIADGISFR